MACYWYPIAISATVRSFHLELANIDDNVYETLRFRVAQHPSENADRVVVRVLARALSRDERLEFGRGLDHTDEPALWSHDDSGQLRLWVDVGAPAAPRLHRAHKHAEKVAVFTDKNLTGLQKEWRGQKIHRSDAIAVTVFSPAFIAELAETVEKQNQWNITLHDGELTVAVGDASIGCTLQHTTVNALVQS